MNWNELASGKPQNVDIETSKEETPVTAKNSWSALAEKSKNLSTETNIFQQYGLGAVEGTLGLPGTLREMGKEAEETRKEKGGAPTPGSLISKGLSGLPEILPTPEEVRTGLTHRPEPQTPAQRIFAETGKGTPGGPAGMGIMGALQILRENDVPEEVVNALNYGAAIYYGAKATGEKGTPTNKPVEAQKLIGREPPSPPTTPTREIVPSGPVQTINKTPSPPTGTPVEPWYMKPQEVKPPEAEIKTAKMAENIPQVATKGAELEPTRITDPTQMKRAISPKLNFKTESQGGQRLTKSVRAQDEAVRSKVNELYNEADEADTFYDIGKNRTPFLKKLPEIRKSITTADVPDSVRSRALHIVDEISKNWDGELIPNRRISDQIKAINSQLVFDFEHGDAKNILNLVKKPLMEELNRTSPKHAIEARKTANEAFIDWVNKFDNDPFIRDLRNKSKNDYFSFFNSSLDPDNIRKLELTGADNNVLSAVKQEYIDRTLSPYTEKPGRFEPSQKFNRDISRARSVLTPNEQALFDKEFARIRTERQRRHDIEITTGRAKEKLKQLQAKEKEARIRYEKKLAQKEEFKKLQAEAIAKAEKEATKENIAREERVRNLVKRIEKEVSEERAQWEEEKQALIDKQAKEEKVLKKHKEKMTKEREAREEQQKKEETAMKDALLDLGLLVVPHGVPFIVLRRIARLLKEKPELKDNLNKIIKKSPNNPEVLERYVDRQVE